MNTEQLYQERLNRYVTAMRNEKPDRIPIRPFVAEFTAKYTGMTCQDVAHDYNKAFEAAIGPRTRAVVPVHMWGAACDMDAIMAIARTRGLRVIEDCAHAIETKYRGKHVGTIGDLGCFSFYVTKNITTGDGCMVVTDNSGYARKIKTMASQV